MGFLSNELTAVCNDIDPCGLALEPARLNGTIVFTGEFAE
jgi:hypothetical protein